MDQEWQHKMDELRDAQMVTQHLLGTLAERHDREIGELRDAQMVTQRLMDANERNWNHRFEQMEETQHALADTVHALADSQRATQAAVDSLIVQIDRFVQGRGSNGH